MADLKIIFGREVRRRRVALRLTQAGLADKADRSIEAVGQIERGEIGATFETVTALAKALKAAPAELFGGQPRLPTESDKSLARIIDRLSFASTKELKRIEKLVSSFLDED